MNINYLGEQKPVQMNIFLVYCQKARLNILETLESQIEEEILKICLPAFHNLCQPAATLCQRATFENKLAKLGDAIAISKSETINDPLTDRGRC